MLNRVFIGYDEREAVTYSVLAHSIMEHASRPVAITPVARRNLPEFTRERGPLDSTDFSISRFLVPYLCEYSDWGLFMDCDFVVTADINDVFAQANPEYAVQVVKMDYRPTEVQKMDGVFDTKYNMKCWSSMMLFNNQRCQNLTLDYVSEAPGLALHQFKWCNEEEIGEISPEWNHLAGYSQNEAKVPKGIHYTRGGPWLPQHKDCQHSSTWNSALVSCIKPIFEENGFVW